MQNPSDTLLLIVDSQTKATRLVNALEPDGYQFEVISNLEDLPAHFSGNLPTLVILWFPYSSPETLSELENLILQIRNLDKTSDLPILLIIDQYGTQFIEPGFKLGVADILSRPIHPLVLRQRVRLLIRARRTEQAEERFRTVADFTYDWEYWKGTDGRLIYNSPACERITGIAAQKFLEQPERLLKIVYSDDREMMRHHFLLEDQSQEVYSLDFRVVTKNNEERWIGHVCQPVYSQAHKFLGRRVSNRDISDRKAAEQAMVRSERLAAIGKLTASLAHEINNPLQAMVSSVELLTEFSLEPEEQKKYLQITYKELERLMKITSGILEFSRPGLSTTRLTYLKAVVEQALFLAANQMRHSKITFELDFPTDLPALMIVPDEISQVCLNLIINALENMPDGGVLKIQARQNGNSQTLSFSDSGSGISAENLSLIFEPFFTTKERGTGLGLAISQEIIHRHRGEIRASSVLGKGSTFIIDLPVDQENIEDHNEWVI